MSSIELFKLISQPWATVKDIQKIAHCGRDVATKIRSEIEQSILNNGKNVPNSKEKIVPMTYVVDYLGLDFERISLIAQHETLIQRTI